MTNIILGYMLVIIGIVIYFICFCFATELADPKIYVIGVIAIILCGGLGTISASPEVEKDMTPIIVEEQKEQTLTPSMIEPNKEYIIVKQEDDTYLIYEKGEIE